MKKVIASIFLITLVGISAKAQNDSLPEGYLVNIDSALAAWQAQKLLHYSTTPAVAVSEEVSDAVYAERLSLLPNIIPMPYNAEVRKYIDASVDRGKQKVSYWLGLANFYMPIFEEFLDKYGVPLELKYLPIIESSLDPTAVSRVGATGLWQFMLATGKNYGLEANSLIDDRRDPIKSTEAAARHLRDLYNIFGDWTLAIASYNCGPANVSKAIRRAGGAKDFWTIYPHLPAETRGYVPAFIAANYVMNYYCEHNITPMVADLNLNTDTVHVERRLHLEQVAGALGLDIAVVRTLNPIYKADIIPQGNYALRLPNANIATFIDLGDSIYNYNREVYNPQNTVLETAETFVAPKPTTTPATRTHTVRRGESLGVIANRYRVTVSQLKSWNGLRSNRINVGQRLKIRK